MTALLVPAPWPVLWSALWPVLSPVLTVVLTTLPTAAVPFVPAPSRDGAWPLRPRPGIVSGFDPPASAWGRGHRGVDLSGRSGQAVHAALGGTVVFAARLAGRGVVVVDHGGVRTTYEPVSASVVVGQRLGKGARIGTLQRASSHCFPRACLHWGLLRGATYLDPLTLVGAGPVRLLPFDAAVGSAPALGAPAWTTGVGAGGLAVRPWGARAGRPGAAVPR